MSWISYLYKPDEGVRTLFPYFFLHWVYEECVLEAALDNLTEAGDGLVHAGDGETGLYHARVEHRDEH